MVKNVFFWRNIIFLLGVVFAVAIVSTSYGKGGLVNDPPSVHRKQVVQNPMGGTSTPTQTQISSASCPDGSVMVGFNLENMGSNFSQFGDVYCHPVVSGITLGEVTTWRKTTVENPWGGDDLSTTQLKVDDASCPSGSVIVGFSLDNLGSNYSRQASLYCRDVKAGSSEKYSRTVAENPWGGTTSPTNEQITSASCPEGYAIGGFNLINMGSNYSKSNVLYCRSVPGVISVTPPSSKAHTPKVDFYISATGSCDSKAKTAEIQKGATAKLCWDAK
ncbi:MAG: hypothetical protein NUV53_00840 [Patescibacteria group bacterium]|nr:hypothetical protein [Patescibacteria group bacterium]